MTVRLSSEKLGQVGAAAEQPKPNAMSATTVNPSTSAIPRDKPRRPSAVRRVANVHAQARHRRVIGLRLSAVLEVLAFIVLALLVDMFLLKGQRFAGITPHPFWAIVLLAATYYGTREALFAAVVCAGVMLLLGPLPLRAVGEGGYAWLLRMVKEPLLWLLAAITLGEIRDAFRRRMIVTQELLFNAQDRVDGLTLACDRLTRQKDSLETRIADQAVTVHAIYNASRAVERDGVGEVLMGVTDLVRTTLSPQKFSLFLLNQNRLEAAVSEGWLLGDRYARVFEPGSPLHSAVVGGRRNVSVVKPEDEAMLRDEGILACHRQQRQRRRGGHAEGGGDGLRGPHRHQRAELPAPVCLDRRIHHPRPALGAHAGRLPRQARGPHRTPVDGRTAAGPDAQHRRTHRHERVVLVDRAHLGHGHPFR